MNVRFKNGRTVSATTLKSGRIIFAVTLKVAEQFSRCNVINCSNVDAAS